LVLNEIAQWAALLFLGIFVLGLTRQLGDFLVPRRERAAQDRGPDVGKGIPEELLSQDERARMSELMAERGVEWAALLIVGEDCPRCQQLIERLIATGVPDDAPVAVVSSRSSASHAELLASAADVVAVDGARLEAADLHIKPFALILDRSFKVLHKQITTDHEQAASAWKGRAGGRRKASANGSGGPPEVIRVGGEQS
jgi:hypothetical protein